jgi:hypothetical protein
MLPFQNMTLEIPLEPSLRKDTLEVDGILLGHGKKPPEDGMNKIMATGDLVTVPAGTTHAQDGERRSKKLYDDHGTFGVHVVLGIDGCINDCLFHGIEQRDKILHATTYASMVGEKKKIQSVHANPASNPGLPISPPLT